MGGRDRVRGPYSAWPVPGNEPQCARDSGQIPGYPSVWQCHPAQITTADAQVSRGIECPCTPHENATGRRAGAPQTRLRAVHAWTCGKYERGPATAREITREIQR